MQTVAETAKLQLAEFLLSIAGGGLWVCVYTVKVGLLSNQMTMFSIGKFILEDEASPTTASWLHLTNPPAPPV